MLQECKTFELNEEELEKINGGSLPNEKGKIVNVAIGDVVYVSGYLDGFDGLYCLVSINEFNTHKFVKYTKGARYIDNSIRFSTVPKGVSITVIDHDDEFVIFNK